MDSEYIITQSGSFISTDELYHHGIRGMKWGVRRYQNADGSLTDKGRKRYTNPDGSLNEKGKKKFGNSVKTAETAGSGTRSSSGESTSTSASTSQKSSEMSSKLSSVNTEDLKKYASRMQVEDNFKQLIEKRGYTVSLDEKTDIDRRIEQLNKEKTLRQLEKEVDKMNRGKTDTERKIEELTQKRDITKLEKEIRDNTPKKESKLSKFLNSQAGSALTTQLIKSGENVLITRLKQKAGDESDNTSKAVKETVDKVTKTLGKEAEKVSKSMDKQAEKQAKREAKDAEKQARKESKAAEKQSRNKSESTEVYEGTVEGEGTSRSSIKNGGRKGPTYDVKDYTETYSSTPVTDLSTTSRSRGYDYIERIKTDYGYRYIYELPSGS